MTGVCSAGSMSTLANEHMMARTFCLQLTPPWYISLCPMASKVEEAGVRIRMGGAELSPSEALEHMQSTLVDMFRVFSGDVISVIEPHVKEHPDGTQALPAPDIAERVEGLASKRWNVKTWTLGRADTGSACVSGAPVMLMGRLRKGEHQKLDPMICAVPMFAHDDDEARYAVQEAMMGYLKQLSGTVADQDYKATSVVATTVGYGPCNLVLVLGGCVLCKNECYREFNRVFGDFKPHPVDKPRQVISTGALVEVCKCMNVFNQTAEHMRTIFKLAKETSENVTLTTSAASEGADRQELKIVNDWGATYTCPMFDRPPLMVFTFDPTSDSSPFKTIMCVAFRSASEDDTRAIGDVCAAYMQRARPDVCGFPGDDRPFDPKTSLHVVASRSTSVYVTRDVEAIMFVFVARQGAESTKAPEATK